MDTRAHMEVLCHFAVYYMEKSRKEYMLESWLFFNNIQLVSLGSGYKKNKISHKNNNVNF